ncbi:MAG: ATP synthase F0 subunit C [Candidatus Margulisbacteria bacterium]|nr:ATP synthase F0 subunit C [Candidatus Margulisiibacteriota bacterium]
MESLAAGLSIGMAALGVSFSLAIVYFKTLDAITRQPDMLATFRVLMFIGFAFIEAIALYALVISFMLIQSHS